MAMANRLEIKQIIRNKSFSFLLPLFKLRYYKNIINTYLGDVKEETAFNNNLYILSSEEDYYLSNNKNYIKHYDVPEGIMYVLKIPSEFESDYNQFLLGKYSKFNENTKKLLCNHACRNSIKKSHETQMYSILYRTEKRKIELEVALGVILPEDAEYASIFNEKMELYGSE